MCTAMPLIAVIDDDLSVRRALRRLIQSGGYAVETFASALEFVDASPRARTACVVLDIHLEGISGFELQERLDADGAEIPIILITAHDDNATHERARRSGAVAYLRKPFARRALLDAIQKALHRTP